MTANFTIELEDLERAMEHDWADDTCLIAQTYMRETGEEVLGVDATSATTRKGYMLSHWEHQGVRGIMKTFDEMWKNSEAYRGHGHTIDMANLILKLPIKFKATRMSKTSLREVIK